MAIENSGWNAQQRPEFEFVFQLSANLDWQPHSVHQRKAY